MRILILIASGILAGWLTRLIMGGRGYGVVGDLILGSLGGMVGGWILRQSARRRRRPTGRISPWPSSGA